MNAYNASKEKLFKSPEIKPHLKMWKYQWVGLPLILLIPIMALLGVFGKKIEHVKISANGIETSIEYPSKMRYGQEEYIRLELKNVSNRTIRNVSVSFDKKFIQIFDSLDFNPQPETNYILKSGDIPPGGIRTLDVKVKAGEYGSHSGKIKVASKNKEILSEELNTFIFP